MPLVIPSVEPNLAPHPNSAVPAWSASRGEQELHLKVDYTGQGKEKGTALQVCGQPSRLYLVRSGGLLEAMGAAEGSIPAPSS